MINSRKIVAYLKTGQTFVTPCGFVYTVLGRTVSGVLVRPAGQARRSFATADGRQVEIVADHEPRIISDQTEVQEVLS